MYSYRHLTLYTFFSMLFIINMMYGSHSKHHILYLAQVGETQKALTYYQDLIQKQQIHDFQLLEDISLIILQQGAASGDDDSLLMSMYALHFLDSLKEGRYIYEIGMKSSNPNIQLTTIQLLKKSQENYVEQLLFKAFSSPYLGIRMEAAQALAAHRSETVVGMIESLMYKLPPAFHIYFPELFAMIGSPEAISILKHLNTHTHLNVRLASILTAAKFGRDDFLSDIRLGITHPNSAEQEVCATALGQLKDTHSINTLKHLATSSPHTHVKLAACQALINIGELSYRNHIINIALNHEPLAIPLLLNIPHTDSLLIQLLEHYNPHIRINAALILLKKRHPACMPILLEILLRTDKDWGLQPAYSLGGSLMSWRAIPSATQHASRSKNDIAGITLSLKEQILQNALELPEDAFLNLAKHIFKHQNHELIPLLVYLLENLNTTSAIELLQQEASHAGDPFIRTYAHLGLYRMKIPGSYKNALYEWVKTHHTHDIFKFRNLLSWEDRKNTESENLLTPTETSRLLIESYQTLVNSHDKYGIDILLNAMKTGNQKNRFLLAGLLLKAIQ